MLRRFISSRGPSLLLGCNVVSHSRSRASSKSSNSKSSNKRSKRGSSKSSNKRSKRGSSKSSRVASRSSNPVKALATHTTADMSTFSAHDATTWGLDTSRPADEEARRLIPLLRPYLLSSHQMSDNDLEDFITLYLKKKYYLYIYAMLSRKSPEEALEEHLAHYASATLEDPGIETPQRFGVEAVELQIRSLFRRDKDMKMQHTKAGVLIGASGVGKTYTALTYPTGRVRAAYAASAIRQITLYLGFNCNSLLTRDEKTYLEARGENEVFVVVLGRLVACLSVALRHPDDLERPDGTDVHKYVKNVSADHLLKAPPELLCGLLKKKVQEQLSMLCDSDSRQTHILVNLDEIQMFDNLIPLMGARLCLRCLRELQFDTFQSMKRRVSIMGLATGIRPEVSLSDKTQGSNTPIGGRLTTLGDFVQIAEEVCTLQNKPFTKRHRVAATLMYPRVRRMVECFTDDPDIPPDVRADKDTAQRLVDANVRGEALDYASIPIWCIHDNSTTTAAVPSLDAVVWPPMLRTLGVSPEGLPDPVSLLRVSNTAVHFEDSAFHIIRVMLQLFYQPPSCLPVLDTTAIAFRKAHRLFSKCLGFGLQTETTKLSISSCFVLTDAKSHYHPFIGNTTHKAAADGPLSEEFQDALGLLEDGSAVLCCCGGDAPLDYIMVRRTGNTLIVWYGDAKYAINHKPVDYALDLCKKASVVHAGLCRELPKHRDLVGCTVRAQYTVCVITTNPQASCDGIEVLSPARFQFKPFSDMLFATLH